MMAAVVTSCSNNSNCDRWRIMLCCVLAFSQHATLFAQAFGIARDTPQRWNVLKSGHQNRPTTFLPASTKASFRQIQRRSFFRLHSSRNGGSSKSRNEDDIPLDWNDEEMLAEFGDLSDADADTSIDDDEEEPRDTEDEMVEFDDEELVDDDDIFLDEISLDDEDDEDDDDEDDEQVGRSIDSGECYHSDEYGEADWDEEVDGGEYELEDDPDDPNYMKQKEIVESAIASSQQRSRDEAFDPFDFVMNEMTEDQASILDKFPFMKEVEERARGMMLSESDVEKIDLDKALEEVPDLARDDPYPRHDPGESNILEALTGVTDDDMEEFDKTYKKIRDKLDEEPWDKVMLKEITGWQHVPNETLDEMSDCLVYLSGSSYNVTRWLLYDLDFNVSNLMLAAIKHNPDAPILFNHWYPQLVTYSRYEHCRERGFDFTWRDVENSDLQELQRYYAGFGYPEIPSKAPSETGIISLEDLDEDEIKMAAFEEWMAEVYNAEGDRKDFDDDDMQDYDNVFSDYYEPPQHPDKPPFGDVVDDIASWREEMGDDPSVVEYRDYMGESFSYDVVHDEEFQREFRGHLVIACTSDDSDLEIAEKITARFQSAFGKQVWVETRVIALAREEDNVFEIWLESYEIDLLHSKKRANSSNQDWKGPAECDDKQIDYLVDRVKFLISDDARYSYRLEYETIN